MASLGASLHPFLRGSALTVSYSLTPPVVVMPSIRAGETDSRFMDCTPDLGPAGDSFTTPGSLTLTITRQDGNTLTANDLALAVGLQFAATLDSTRLIPTFWYAAPLLSAGVAYYLTLAGTTTQGRAFVRDWAITSMAQLG
jgi:hypothetical protein